MGKQAVSSKIPESYFGLESNKYILFLQNKRRWRDYKDIYLVTEVKHVKIWSI